LIVLRYDEGKKESLLTHTDNVGVGGISAVIKKNLKVFSLVDVELDLMDLGAHIKCQGKVVWSIRRKNEDPAKPMFYDVGIEFVDVSAEDRARVERVVVKLAKQIGVVP
ncbi:MAG: PilZ domain-containing protein, partial [Candidatus Omnitrophota bacterium]|nr:PilZ domain-containing protein [Candidatus Omnitrophota bacterium]